MNRRPLFEIAKDIEKEWKNVNYAARPYLDAMKELTSIEDSFGFDSGQSIVAYFLSNASSFRGPRARELKDELRSL